MQLSAWSKKQKILLASLVGAALLGVLILVIAILPRGAAETIVFDDAPEEADTVQYDDTVDSMQINARSDTAIKPVL